MWQNTKCDESQNVTKLKNSKKDKTQKHRMWQNSKTQNLTNSKNSKCDKTPKIKMWKKKNVKKLKNSICDKSKCDKQKKWQISTNQKVTKI